MPRRRIALLHIVGARPNYMKTAPLLRAWKKRRGFRPLLVHTGQHYDYLMSKAFFVDLKLPRPDLYLGVGSGTHAEQTAAALVGIERALNKFRPELAVVVGDVNSTLAGALAAAKCQVPVAHVEAGLRSFDRSMPEELNRMLTDALSEFCFIHSPEAAVNLRREGVARRKIYNVGNVMIDSLLEQLRALDRKPARLPFALPREGFALLTMHRPSNVDQRPLLRGLLRALARCSRRLPILFPAHPRTHKSLRRHGLGEFVAPLGRRPPPRRKLWITPPMAYSEFIQAMSSARLVLTDSGGVQEETTVLGIPCLTLRRTTERPITVRLGTNTIVGQDLEKLRREFHRILDRPPRGGRRPRYWDGKAAERIVSILASHYAS